MSEVLGAPDQAVDSVRAIRSFATPPKSIPPILPFPMGRASSQRLASLLYQSTWCGVPVSSAGTRRFLAGRAARAKLPRRNSRLVGVIGSSLHVHLGRFLGSR